MTTSTLDQVLEQIKSLSPDEQKQLRDILDGMLAKGEPRTTEEEFEQRLLERGVISHIPSPITDFTAYQNRKLIEVKGKPLSETIIEERR